MSEPKRTPSSRRSGSETADLVAQVLEDQARREQARSKKPPPPSRGRQQFAAISLPMLAAFSFYVWFASPAWVTPTVPDPVTEVRATAGLRTAMYFQIQRIESFREEEGRLPDVLAETGSSPGEMVYERVDSRTYRLTGESRGVTLSYTSDVPPGEFLGDAMQQIGIGTGS